MRYLSFILLIMAAASCNSGGKGNHSNRNTGGDTVIIRDTVYICPVSDSAWQYNFGLSHNPALDTIWYKPASFYLNDPECVPIAADFYYGRFKPSDNGATTELLKYAYTNNDKLRPFYRWCLNKCIQISDGALGEIIGLPARRYAERFPKEFFEYMDYDTTGGKYREWVAAIAYSGFEKTDDHKQPAEIQGRLLKVMTANCKACDPIILERIRKFAKDCFHAS